MVRILHIVSTLGRGSGVMGVIMNYYRCLDRKQMQFDFLYFSYQQDNYLQEIQELGGRVYSISRPRISPAFLQELNGFFRDNGGCYQIIHCHPIFGSVIFGVAARCHGIHHVIQHSHSTRYSEKKWSAIRNRILIGLIPCCATELVACSTQAATLFGTKAQRRLPLLILPNAIDCAEFAYSRKSRARLRWELQLEDRFVIGHVGRFSKEKNHRFLLDVFSYVLQQRPDAVLLLIGGGKELPRIRTAARQMGISYGVYFLGIRQDIPPLLCAMDVFAMPSQFEGVPVAALEAQANGLPCVLSDAITREVNCGHVCYLSTDDARLWAETILGFCKDGYDRTAARTLVTEHGFDISNQCRKLQNYYLQLSD